MKRLNFLTIALAMVLGMTSLTSCLNSDNDTTQTGIVVAKVTSSMGFTYFRTADGRTITPSTESMNNATANGIDFSDYQGQIVYLTYTWDSAVLDISEDDKDITGVTLWGFSPMDSPVEIVETLGAPNDSIGNAPVIGLGRQRTTGASSLTETAAEFFDSNTLLLPINYYCDRYQHNFTMVYYPNEPVSANNEMTVYLRNDMERDTLITPGSYTSQQWAYSSYYNYFSIYVRAFDFTQALIRFRNQQGLGGMDEVTIRVVAPQAQYSVEMDDAEQTVYTYTYQAPTTN